MTRRTLSISATSRTFAQSVFHSQAENPRATGVECQTCHGPVEEMARVTRRVDLNENLRMPWCIDCHTKEKVSNGRDCLSATSRTTCHY